MRVLRTAFVVTVIGIAVSGLADSRRSPLSATLLMEPSTTLPGIPVRVTLEIENKGETAATLPSRMSLRVVPTIGEPFIASTGGDADGSVMFHPRGENAVQPRERRRFVFSNFGQESPVWFVDPRLNAPGTYRLDALLSESPIRTDTPVVNADIESLTIGKSNSALLTVVEPRGEDAVVWQRVGQLAHERFGTATFSNAYWTAIREQVAREVWRDHPRSAYAAYLIDSIVDTPARKIAIAEKLLGMRPQNADTIRFVIAALHARLAREAETERHRDLQEALRVAALAREEFVSLIAQTDDPSVQRAAQQELAQIGTADEITANDAEVARAQERRRPPR